MVERRRPREASVKARPRRKRKSGRSRRTGRPNGRPPGRESEYKRVAKARAAMTGQLPDELLLEWARTGQMKEVYKKKGEDGKMKEVVTQLTPADRIACAKAAAPFYKAPMVKIQGDEVRPLVLQLDASRLVGVNMTQLKMLEALFGMLEQGGATLPGLAALLGPAKGADPARYARELHADSETEGSA